MARAEAGAGGGESTAAAPVDLRALAAEAVAGQALIAADRGIDLGLLEGPDASVPGHGDSLRILLDNLIDNALRHTPAGGRVDVVVLPASADSGPGLEVSDSGPGIDPDHLERVFERFHRAPGSGGAGSGLGLAIVREIAASHGADIRLENQPDAPTAPGRGLRAVLRFPRP